MKYLVLARDPDGCYYVVSDDIRELRGPKCNSAAKAIRRYRAKGFKWFR